jgi:hypothetical protein
MPRDLSIPELEAVMRVCVSLVRGLAADAAFKDRHREHQRLTHELMLKYWDGIPGHPTGERTVPSYTDWNSRAVLEATLDLIPRELPAIR